MFHCTRLYVRKFEKIVDGFIKSKYSADVLIIFHPGRKILRRLPLNFFFCADVLVPVFSALAGEGGVKVSRSWVANLRRVQNPAAQPMCIRPRKG
jgi:hypothetical protein